MVVGWCARQQSNKEAASESLTACCASIFDALLFDLTTLPRLDRLNSSINSDEAGHDESSLNLDQSKLIININHHATLLVIAGPFSVHVMPKAQPQLTSYITLPTYLLVPACSLLESYMCTCTCVDDV